MHDTADHVIRFSGVAIVRKASGKSTETLIIPHPDIADDFDLTDAESTVARWYFEGIWGRQAKVQARYKGKPDRVHPRRAARTPVTYGDRKSLFRSMAPNPKTSAKTIATSSKGRAGTAIGAHAKPGTIRGSTQRPFPSPYLPHSNVVP
jgi:hypothetical protein